MVRDKPQPLGQVIRLHFQVHHVHIIPKPTPSSHKLGSCHKALDNPATLRELVDKGEYMKHQKNEFESGKELKDAQGQTFITVIVFL